MCRVGFYPAAHDTRSVFADFDTMRRINPLGRIPSLVLDHDSATILDWLDQSVGPERALVPATGPERRRALRRIALATGAIEKAGAAVYEQPSTYRWPDWIERCRTQAAGALSRPSPPSPGRRANGSTRRRSPPPA
jgi:glutathione S-transferase